MKSTTTHILCLSFVALSFALAAWLYPQLPEQVPVQWNMYDEINRTLPKPLGAFVMPLSCLGICVLLWILPYISPKGFGLERFARTYETLQLCMVAFFFFVAVLQLLAAAGMGIPAGRSTSFAMGLMFVVLGNFMGKLTTNFFVGIRTPWTLASKEVWLRTHRLGGKLFVLSGFILVLSGLLDGGFIPLFVVTALLVVVLVLYSYLLYRRLEQPQEADSSFDS